MGSKAKWLLRHHPDVMILADRGFANHDLLSFLQASNWHYCIRITCDTQLHGIRRQLLAPIPLLSKDPEPCFASKKARQDISYGIWFSRIYYEGVQSLI